MSSSMCLVTFMREPECQELVWNAVHETKADRFDLSTDLTTPFASAIRQAVRKHAMRVSGAAVKEAAQKLYEEYEDEIWGPMVCRSRTAGCRGR